MSNSVFNTPIFPFDGAASELGMFPIVAVSTPPPTSGNIAIFNMPSQLFNVIILN